MPERGGYRPSVEVGKEAKDKAIVNAGIRPPRKFTRRDFLELAGAVGAGALLGAKIGENIIGNDNSPESMPAEPKKVSPPSPPENLPVEPLPIQHNQQMPPAEKGARYGVNSRQKKKEDTNKTRGKKRENKNKKQPKRSKEFFEVQDTMWAEILRKELERLYLASVDTSDKIKLDEIFAKEDEQIIKERLGGANLKLRMAHNYFALVEKNPRLYLEPFARAAASAGVPLQILFSVFAIEGAGRQSNRNRFLFEENTARAYGLAVDKEHGVDERADLDKSARACAKYLRDLHGAFGNQWGLALGAYNGGSGHLRGLLKRHFSVEPTRVRTRLGFQFAEDELAQQGINAASLYLKELSHLMARKTDKKSRFALRSIWYPFAADALGGIGWKIVMESVAKKKVARAFPNLEK